MYVSVLIHMHAHTQVNVEAFLKCYAVTCYSNS